MGCNNPPITILGTNTIQILEMQKDQLRRRRPVALTITIVVLLGLMGSAALGVEFHTSQETLNPRVYPSPSSGTVDTVNFNDSQGRAIADFNFIVNPLVTNSTSSTALTVGPSIWHAQGTRLESLRLQFAPMNVSSDCAVTSGGLNYYTDGYPPYQAKTQEYANGSLSLNIPSFGPQGAATVTFGLGLALPSGCNTGNAASLLQMKIKLVLNSNPSLFIGKTYSGYSTVGVPL
jgi:hypothetical protein